MKQRRRPYHVLVGDGQQVALIVAELVALPAPPAWLSAPGRSYPCFRLQEEGEESQRLDSPQSSFQQHQTDGQEEEEEEEEI